MLSLSALELVKASIENVDSQEVKEFVKTLEHDAGKNGICSLYQNAVKFLGISLAKTSDVSIRNVAETWEYFSGDRWYPVPDPRHTGPDTDVMYTNASAIYATTELMWENEYGQLRMSLLNHLIETAKTQGA